MLIRGERPSISGCEVLQQLNPRSTICAQSCNAQMGAKYVIQMPLLCSIILALAGHAHSEQVAVELQAGLGVPHHDDREIDAEEEFAGRPLPFFWALSLRQPQDPHGMLIQIFEIEGGDTGCVLVPVRKSLRP